jgi:alanyl-tRNA synthetase
VRSGIAGPPIPGKRTIMDTKTTLTMFRDFYLERGHVEVTGTSLLPEPGDPVLFTTSGMHPLTPYLEGRPHPQGRRLLNRQRCLRTTDLDEVGDLSHLTVFEMLGTWSLGDYGHPQSVRWGHELLTDGFGVPRDQIYVTVFGGDPQVGPDTGSVEVWDELGVPVELLGDDNWWSNGPTGLCGTDTEIFVWTGPGDPTGTPSTDDRWVEVWNHVNLRFRRDGDGLLRPLDPPNVDTGMGLERLLMVLQDKHSVFDTDLFEPWRDLPWTLPDESRRLVVDHLRSSIVVIGEGIRPSNTGRGYVLRRLIRRCLTTLRRVDPGYTLSDLPLDVVSQTLDHFGPSTDVRTVRSILTGEEQKFVTLLERGRGQVRKLRRRGPLTDSDYHFLLDTHGLPRDLVEAVLEDQT